MDAAPVGRAETEDKEKVATTNTRRTRRDIISKLEIAWKSKSQV
jgi:hypothetical protein